MEIIFDKNDMGMIFDKKKFYADFKKNNIESNKAITEKWVNKCDGKSVEFCNKLGLLIDSDWCIKK